MATHSSLWNGQEGAGGDRQRRYTSMSRAMGDAARGLPTTGCIHGMVGGDNQDETTRIMLEAAGPLIRMSPLIAQPAELQPYSMEICLW